MVCRTHLLGTLAVAGMFITVPVHAVQLHRAARNGNLEEVSRLIAQRSDVNAQSNNGVTPLYLASQQGHGEIVRILLSNGADVNAEVSDGTTAIDMAEQQGHQEIVEILKNAGGR